MFLLTWFSSPHQPICPSLETLQFAAILPEIHFSDTNTTLWNNAELSLYFWYDNSISVSKNYTDYFWKLHTPTTPWTDCMLYPRQIITQSKNSLIIQGKDKMALGYTDHRRPFLNTFAQMTKTISRPGFLNKMEYLKDMVFIKEYHVIMVYVP